MDNSTTTTTTTKSLSIEDGYVVHSNVQLETSRDAKMINEIFHKIAMSTTLLYKKYTFYRIDVLGLPRK